MKLRSIVLLLSLTACSETTPSTPVVTESNGILNEVSNNPDTPTEASSVSQPILGKKLHLDSDFELVSLSETQIDPAPEDSIIYQMVYELEPNKYIIIAQPIKETFEGVRLQLVSKTKKGAYKLLDASSPGYDSPMLYPTFYKNTKGEYIIIANTGSSDSWGLKVYSLIGKKFRDLGFIDMATIEKREYPDENGRMERYGNISKHVKIKSHHDHLTFELNGDKMILFEDLDHHHDVPFTKGAYEYTYNNKSFELHKK